MLLEKYFRLEDPTAITPIGIELKLEVEVGGVRLRGIIDRLELDADGELVVTDYKTGRAPGERQEQQRLAGVAFYSLLCERLFGRRPARVQLLYLADPRRHHLRAHRSQHPRASSASWPPSGRRSSGPASGRTSGPTRAACATGAGSRPTARRSGATSPRPTPTGSTRSSQRQAAAEPALA